MLNSGCPGRSIRPGQMTPPVSSTRTPAGGAAWTAATSPPETTTHPGSSTSAGVTTQPARATASAGGAPRGAAALGGRGGAPVTRGGWARSRRPSTAATPPQRDAADQPRRSHRALAGAQPAVLPRPAGPPGGGAGEHDHRRAGRDRALPRDRRRLRRAARAAVRGRGRPLRARPAPPGPRRALAGCRRRRGRLGPGARGRAARVGLLARLLRRVPARPGRAQAGGGAPVMPFVDLHHVAPAVIVE